MKARVPWMEVLFLALLAPLMWPPSTIAQQLRPTAAPAKLGPTLNLLFVDLHPASSSSAELPLAPGARRGQPSADVRFLLCGTDKLTYEPLTASNSTEPAKAPRGDLRPARPMQIEGSLTPLAARRLEVARVPPAESERLQRLPTLYEEDTPFSTQVRLPLFDLWGGRLQFDGFYREISADSVFRGLPQSSGVWWTTQGNPMLRPGVSCGIHVSFRMLHMGRGTLCRYLVRGCG